MMQSKKGDSDAITSTLVFTMLFIIAVGVATGALAAFGTNKMAASTEIQKGVEEDTIFPKFYNTCFFYEDPVGRRYNGAIDFSKFTEEILVNCHNDDHSPYSVELSLTAPGIEGGTKTIKSKNYIENYQSIEHLEDVFVFIDNKRVEGKLLIKQKNG